MKTFNEEQMLNPWRWCLKVIIEKHDITSNLLADTIGAPRSTIRALYNGSNVNPRYDLLVKLIKFSIDLESGDWTPESALEDTFDIDEFL